MQEEELRELLHQFKQAVEGKYAWWNYMTMLAQAQIKLRENQILLDIDESVYDVFRGMGFKGERKGIKLFLELPKTIVEDLIQKLEEEDYGRSGENSTDGE